MADTSHINEIQKDGHKVGVSQGISQGINKGKQIGIINTLVQLVYDGLLSFSIAAERDQMTTEEFKKHYRFI